MRGRRHYGYEMADPMLYEQLKQFAAQHRKAPTEAESVLWELLKGKVLGVSFRRQHIIGPYIADFACLSHKFIIEVDGGYHQLPNQQTSDQERTAWLENKGFKVLRFTNEEILTDAESVLNKIKAYVINERIL